MHTRSDDDSFRSRKLTKTLSNFFIFTDGKKLFIDQVLFKMQSKFEIN